MNLVMKIRCIFYVRIGFLVFVYFIFYRDLVYWQIVCVVIKYMVLGVLGFGCEDVFIYFINYVWFNIFEILFYVVNVVMEFIEGMRVVFGFFKVFYYCLQVRSYIIVVYYVSCDFLYVFYKVGWNNVSVCF